MISMHFMGVAFPPQLQIFLRETKCFQYISKNCMTRLNHMFCCALQMHYSWEQGKLNETTPVLVMDMKCSFGPVDMEHHIYIYMN